MKRTLIILSFFVFLFALLCVSGCDCNSDGEGCMGCKTMTAIGGKKDKWIDCASTSCFEAGEEEVELNGCYVNNSWLDCFWAPSACGCYENELSMSQKDNSTFVGCLGTPSCVVCGFDLTLLETYTPPVIEDLSVDKRNQVPAVKGVDYTIDRVRVTADFGDFDVFLDGTFNAEDIAIFIEKIMLYGEDATIYYTVEFTANTELHSAECGFLIEYNGYDWNNFSSKAYTTMGNSASSATHDKNIQPGKHVMRAAVELDMYEMFQLERFYGEFFNAIKYEGGN